MRPLFRAHVTRRASRDIDANLDSPIVISKSSARTIIVLLTITAALAATCVILLIARDFHLSWFSFSRLRVPQTLLLEDFQRSLDRQFVERFDKFEQTGVSDWIDEHMIKPLLDDVVTKQIDVSGVELTEEQFPQRRELHRIVQECAAIMKIAPPRVYVVEAPELNAFTTNAADPIIILHSSVLSAFRDPRELRFIIGHEMGHIRCHHVKLMMLLQLVKGFLPDKIQPVFALSLLKWSREAEMSADRAGLVCCQNLNAAEQALVRLAMGADKETVGRVNVDAFLHQRERENMSTVSEISFFISQLAQTHPFVPARIADLREYAKSPQYRHIWQ